MNHCLDHLHNLCKSLLSICAATTQISLVMLPVMSLVQTKNNKRPNIDPWGTPAFTTSQEDEQPSKTNRCLRLQRYSSFVST